MDLRSIINVSEAAENSAQKHASTPVTPSHAGPSPFRDFAGHPPPQASPYRHPSQDIAPPSYKSPTTTFPGASYHHSRPAPPLQLQPSSQSDLRSPATSSHHSAQSPYRHTPTSSFSGHQYPFPQNQAPQSPISHQISLQQRDAYPNSANPPSQIQHQHSYSQSPSIPQTPPVGTPGNSYPYPPQHPRSHSSHSSSTPTSAQSQHQFYGQQIHDSPVSVSHPLPPQVASHHHHPSQPGTPLGPPISIPRQSSGAYSQPQSPYSQRAPSTGGFAPQYSTVQTSPAPPPPQISRLPSTPTSFEPHRMSGSEPSRLSHRERSQSERDRSMSVSPRTRLPHHTKIYTPSAQAGDMDASKDIKREREDSETSHAVTLNGRHSVDSHAIPSPVQRAKKRKRYTEPPIWFRSWRKAGGKLASSFAATNRSSPVHTNGKPISKAPVHLIDLPAAPPYTKPAGRGQSPPPSQSTPLEPFQLKDDLAEKRQVLGLWEPSILGVQPMEESSRIIADWLFHEVVHRSDVNEMASHGIHIEVEAKLGRITDANTHERLRLPIRSECIMAPGKGGIAGETRVQWTFVSSMTEVQHKAMNDFLNQKAQESYLQGPDKVPIQYKHRKERDTFYELPRNMRKSLPSMIQATSNQHHSLKVRVTHDEKTNEQLAKIIKTRVSDLDIFLPGQEVDCRISINLEMAYDGDIEDLVASSGGQRFPARSKDRLSYSTSHYQFDLTQVTMADGAQRPTKEHELEIELSTAALMEQGNLAKDSMPHRYPELIQGLLDNIRVLARHVPRA